jgi:hypothetical protein
MQEISDALETAMAAAASELTEHLRDQAQKSGWADELARSVNIGYAGSILDVNIDPQAEREVFDKEYGTEESAPTAILRRMGHHPRTNQILKKHINEHLPDAFDTAFARLL